MGEMYRINYLTTGWVVIKMSNLCICLDIKDFYEYQL